MARQLFGRGVRGTSVALELVYTMAPRFGPWIRTAQGAATVLPRRGVGYLGHLLSGLVSPRAAYRFGWGPTASPLAQGVFAAAGELAAAKPDVAELRALALLTRDASSRAGDAPLDQVEALMDRAHAAGITGVGRNLRNLGRDADGALRFRALPGVSRHHRGSLAFAAARDADRREFNQVFGASVLTEATARAAVAALERRASPSHDESPAFDVGFATDPGMAVDANNPWDAFNRDIVGPLVAGKRVLTLGTDNGSLPVTLLRSGAANVVAIESAAEIAELARLHAQILSWRTIRPYPLTILSGDLRQFLAPSVDRYDIVMALALYRLPPDDMAQIVRKAAAMDAVLVLQANEMLESGHPGKTLDLHRMMRDNGYFDLAVHTPAGFSRPVLIGSTEAGLEHGLLDAGTPSERRGFAGPSPVRSRDRRVG
jgi:hypothetical protein